MAQIPLLSGVLATENADFALSYPVNLEPIATDSGISRGYVRSAMGAVAFTTGPGIDRGGIAWNGVMYRVMGTKLVSIGSTGVVTELGDVGGSGPVSLDYGFGRLAIRSGVNLFYWDGATLTQVTDPDLGVCLDVVWMDGYYVSTDGTSVVVTQLADPTSIDPLKYGSAESDPDMVTGLLHLRSELYVMGQNTIEVNSDQGGSGFPFQRNNGATIPVGCVGPQAKCRFLETFAFVGAGRNDALAVWIANGGSAQKISTRQIDDYLAKVADPTQIALERRVSRDESRLYVHLPDVTLVYLPSASAKTGEPVWYEARSGRGMDKPYRLRNAVFCYGKWFVGDTETAQIGVLDEATGEHFGEAVGWRLDTVLAYNQAKGGIVHMLELVGLPGRGQTAQNPSVFVSFTLDGETWGQERTSREMAPGARSQRVTWSPHKRFRLYMGIRFRGDSSSLAGWAALEADVEALAA